MSVVRDVALAAQGRKKIEWARAHMPVLGSITRDFEQNRPFEGKTLAVSVHLEAKTACLALTLKAGGADVYVTGSNPLSTKDDVAAGLSEMGCNVFAWYGASDEEYRQHLQMTLGGHPHVVLDDGGDLVELLHGDSKDCADRLLGGTEETTTGVLRLRQRTAAGKLDFPMIAVNDADCKHLFDNPHGTGQSVWDAIMNTTNCLIAGKTVVVGGYGFCSSGIAKRAAGLGAHVVVTEVNPIRALQAMMDGYRVMSMDEAAPVGDIFVSATGCSRVVTGRHFAVMKNGAMLANAGHFDVEIDKATLDQTAKETFEARENITGYRLDDGRVLYLLGGGRLVNLAAGNGHPVEIMDLSFAIQALAMKYVLDEGPALSKGVHLVPRSVDEAVAAIKLRTMGVTIDALSKEQQEYLKSY